MIRSFSLVSGLLLLALSGVACGGGPDKLSGSLDEYYDLSFVETRARLFPSQLSVEWIDEDREVVVRATVNVNQVSLEGPATVDLALYGDLSGRSGGTPIPEMESGTLVLDAYAPEAGAAVEGSLDAEVIGQRGNATVSGQFKTILDDQR
ncbi:MAG: hypothetical protein P1V51_03215 [Deltaproteobacteria bacterium]|nr:hypothetical protein [Deltaproteobacteria bacterium]